MIKLLLDQGIPYSTVRLLAETGWDVVHVSDIQMQQATDQAILDYASERKRVCVTLDADFHGLLAVNNMETPSVIRIRQEGLKGADMAKLLRGIWPMIETKIEQGAMVTVTEKNIRIRYLPILSDRHAHT